MENEFIKVERVHSRVPLTGASIVFVALLVGIFFVWRNIEVFDTALLFLGTLVVMAFLIAANVKQLLTERVRTRTLAGRLTNDILSSRELFLSLFRNSPVPYILVEQDGTIAFPNATAVQLFGETEESLKGKLLFEMIGSDPSEEVHVAMIHQKMIQGLFVNNEEVFITRSDGSVRWVLLSVFPFKSSRTQNNGLVTLFDITKQKQIDKAKTEFVSLASHQLRTPISAMKWNMELLVSDRYGGLSEEQKKYEGKVEHGLARMDAIVNDFLNVSKLELGTLTSEPVEIVLADFFDETLEEHRERIHQKGIAVHTQYDDSVRTIHTDKQLLRMAVGNLISNAVKYTPEGGNVSISYVGESGILTISVTDTGVGIPPEEQEQIFTKLFRASNVRDEISDGTGLGLYIAKQAVETIKGSISFRSTPGQGTTFIIKLPL